jgi:hypothetical protein
MLLETREFCRTRSRQKESDTVTRATQHVLSGASTGPKPNADREDHA